MSTFEPGYRLVDGTSLNNMGVTGPTGPAGSTGATGAAASTSSPTFTGTTTVAALTATGAVSMSNASISMSSLPTVDPNVVGRLWSNSGVLTISAGP